MAKRIVFVTGTRNSGKDAVIEYAMKNKRDFSGVEVLDMKEIMLGTGIKPDNIENARALRKATMEGLSQSLSKSEASRIIINGFFVLKTPFGYFPIISSDFFRKFEPDFFLIVEAERIPTGINTFILEKGLLKEMNRMYALHFSSASEAAIRTMKVDYHNLKDTFALATEIFKDMLG